MFNDKNFLFENGIICDVDFGHYKKYEESQELVLFKYNNANIIWCKSNKNMTINDEILSDVLIQIEDKYILCSRYNFNYVDNSKHIVDIKNNSVSKITKEKQGNYLLINSTNYNYYHFMVDTIFITYFYYNDITQYLGDENLTILVPSENFLNYIHKSNVLTNFLNVKNILIEVFENNYKYENLYFGKNIHNINNLQNEKYHNYIQKLFYSIKHDTIINHAKCLYISKKNYAKTQSETNIKINNKGHRKIVNEDIFVNFLMSINVDIIELSDKNFEEKSNLMNNYETIILHTGATTLNCFFNKGFGKIIILNDEYVRWSGRNILFNKNNITVIDNHIKLINEKNNHECEVGDRMFVDIENLKEKILSIIE